MNECAGCGGPLSEEDGITLVMDDANLREYYCATCKPPGSGYTLTDLEKWRENNQAERAKHEMAMMDLVGPDVYFAIKGRDGKPSPIRRLLELNQRVHNKLREIGAGENDGMPEG